MRQLVVAFVGLCSFLVTPVQASPVTFDFTGTVTGVGSDDLGLGVAVGTPITGSYTFDSSASNVRPPGGSASYQMGGSPYGFTALILGHPFGTSDFLAVNVVNNNPDDEYGILACAGGLSGCSASGDTYLVFNWLLTDSTRAAFSSTALPLTPPSPAAFQTNFFELDNLTASGALESVQGRITTLSQPSEVVVPEPGALLLLGSGFGALAFAQRALRFSILAPPNLTRRRRLAAMWTNKARSFGAVVVALILVTGFVRVAHAVDGVFLITQNLVNASGGFPYTISQPGSYRLASNLTVPDANTTAILVVTDNVTVDLNGFSIMGPVVCTGTPATCSPANGVGSGVEASGARNVTVMNGTVRGMSRSGVAVGDNGTVRSIRVVSHGGNPFAIAILIGNNSLATENIVRDTSSEGIFGASGDTITKNVVTNTRFSGINTTGAGGVGGTISDNTCRQNSFGISSGASYLVIGNSVADARNGGLDLQPTTGYANNVLNNPATFFGNVALGQGVNMGHNVCGAALCP